MNLDQYKQMHVQTNRLLRREYQVFCSYSRGTVVDRWAASYLLVKLEGRPARAYFARAMSDWLLGLKASWCRWSQSVAKKRLVEAQIPFLFELVISIQYLHNQILDGKAGVTTTDRIADNLLLANLLKEQLYRYIDAEVAPAYRQVVTQHIRQCFEWVDLGQQLERLTNNYRHLHQHELRDVLPDGLSQEIDLTAIQAFIQKTKQSLPRFLHQELDHYFQRIYLTCAALFVTITQLNARVLGMAKRQVRAPLHFSVCYGIMRQLVNDNADWVSTQETLHTQEKLSTDAGSDLRNKTLTLPLFFWLAEPHSPSSSIEQLLHDKQAWNTQAAKAAFTEIIESHALFKAVQHTRILAEVAVSFLPAERSDLARACEIAHWNKFLVPVLRHPAYADFRQTPSHRRTKQLIRQLRRARKQGPAPTPASAWGNWRSRLGASASPLPHAAQSALSLLRR
ncbi:MAG: hypothetical protein D6772_06740 [Bacteroidetes bacterium]|nr:MAG: hypothetical protein D6772_06740 [Bacteroidota bacterium]